jgi:hypothetical protein
VWRRRLCDLIWEVARVNVAFPDPPIAPPVTPERGA